MKKIQKIADQICEELEGATEYIECALDFKVQGNSNWYSKYKSMAEQELSHAMILHDRAVEEITLLKKVYTPPVEMEKKWEEIHKTYVEKAAWIKQMMAM